MVVAKKWTVDSILRLHVHRGFMFEIFFLCSQHFVVCIYSSDLIRKSLWNEVDQK